MTWSSPACTGGRHRSLFLRFRNTPVASTGAATGACKSVAVGPTDANLEFVRLQTATDLRTQIDDIIFWPSKLCSDSTLVTQEGVS